MDEDARHLILTLRSDFSAYHHHKEQMAFGAAGLYLGGAIALLLLANTPWDQLVGSQASALAIFVSGVAGWAFVAWQFSKRRYAADVVSACTQLAIKWLAKAPGASDLEPTRCKDQGWPKALRDEILEVEFRHGWFDEPGKSELATYLVMIVWSIAVIVRWL